MANSNSIVLFSTLSYYDGKIKTYIGNKDAAVLQSAKDYVDGLVADISEYSLVKATTATDGYVATYNLTKNGVIVGDSINIPKDFVVKSASIKECTIADAPETGYVVGDKYIDFIVNTVDNTGNETHIYLKVTDLVDVYVAGDGIAISENNTISLIAQDGTKTIGGISSADYASFSGAVTKSEANETDIEAINDPATGVVAIAEAYADSLNTAMDARVQVLENAPYASSDDIDSLFV